MDTHKGDNNGTQTQRKISQDEAKALKKCLEENKGDYNKCKSKIDSFHSSSSSSSSSSSKSKSSRSKIPVAPESKSKSPSTKPEPPPFAKLRTGSLTDV